MEIKTRFAPSPTGDLHIGNIRTALYSWLFARSLGGKFVLRIDDTNIESSKESAINSIIEIMNWLNLYWDEGPYVQSKRLYRYNTVIDNMLSKHTAYKCYCSKDRLKTLREAQIARGYKPRYDNHCLNNRQYYDKTKPYVVRFNNPKDGLVIFTDIIHGIIKFRNIELDDFIIRRTDGSPTYNFCVVVDDLDMAITHVIRGDDHINNTPRQINILKALGAHIPHYAHLSTIKGEDSKKLSKSSGTIGIMQYRDNGFLPEAILNYLVRLGWSHNNKEIFSLNEMKKLFNFKNVSKSSSKCNIKKLLWLNHHYINHLPAEYVSTHLYRIIEKQGININSGPKLTDIVPILGQRCKTLKEIAMTCRYFYEDLIIFDTDAAKKYLITEAIPVLKVVRTKLEQINEWKKDSIYTALKQTADELKLSIEKINMPLRVTVTGKSFSPAINIIIHAIGKLRSLYRIDFALHYINHKI